MQTMLGVALGCYVYAAASALHYNIVFIRVAIAADFLAPLSMCIFDLAAIFGNWWKSHNARWNKVHAPITDRLSVWPMRAYASVLAGVFLRMVSRTRLAAAAYNDCLRFVNNSAYLTEAARNALVRWVRAFGT